MRHRATIGKKGRDSQWSSLRHVHSFFLKKRKKDEAPQKKSLMNGNHHFLYLFFYNKEK